MTESLYPDEQHNEQVSLKRGLNAVENTTTTNTKMSRKSVNPDYFVRLSNAMRETRKRVSQYSDQERARLDQLARSWMGQPVSVNVSRAGR